MSSFSRYSKQAASQATPGGDVSKHVLPVIDNRLQAVKQRKEMKSITNNQRTVAQRQAFAEAIGSNNPKPNSTGMPDTLKTGLENYSGIDLSDIKVHYNSSKPAQLQALAYAQGIEIHIGPGQEKHLPHEGWHVVQQRQGRVMPTKQMKAGVYINDHKGLEHEATVMGSRAAEMRFQARATAETHGKTPVKQAIRRKIIPSSITQVKEAVIQRMVIPDEVKAGSGLILNPDQWRILGDMIDIYNADLDNLKWYHGTTSSSLALMDDGQLGSAADLLKARKVPLSGEVGNALHPKSINKDGASGVDLQNLSGALKYAQSQGEDDHLQTLFKSFNQLIKEAEDLIREALLTKTDDEIEQNNAILQVRKANVKLARFVWSAHLFAPQNEEAYGPMIKGVLQFNVFLQGAYETAGKSHPHIASEIENLVDVFNQARTDSYRAYGTGQHEMINENFPVLYSAQGGKFLAHGSSDISGETLLSGAHLRSAHAKDDSPNQIKIIFVPWNRVEIVASAMARNFKLTVLPIELIKVYQRIKHQPVVLASDPGAALRARRLAAKKAAATSATVPKEK